ncbi:copper resistance protein NlpE N-terminal domain-containing protein [uncultured Psychrobacter sp.]|uniref:copper resistance protein NlpE N-terminal domain-containing protein n=1 Tax=uncultured Psychrobacter sp. TaxID=259303 RepID=UPI0034575E63
MNYSTFTVFTTILSIRHFGRLLLSLFFCTILLSCDDQSATVTYDDASNQSTPVQQTDDAAYSKNPASTDNIEDINQGESLIAAAQPNDPNNSIRTRRAPMISETSTDEALQATLIGDYVGILPCKFCTDISVTLNLFSDGSVLKTSIYQNPEEPTLPLIEPGIYRQDNAVITVVYDNKNIESYSIQNNHLVMMNNDESLNADYTLSRK